MAIACAVLASIPRWHTQSRKIEAYPALQIHDPMPPRPCVFFQRTPSVSQVVYPMYTVLQHHLADGRASTKFRVREATAESVSIAKANFVLAEDCLLHSPPRSELLSGLWHTVLPCRLHAFRGFTTNKRVRVTSNRLARCLSFCCCSLPDMLASRLRLASRSACARVVSRAAYARSFATVPTVSFTPEGVLQTGYFDPSRVY